MTDTVIVWVYILGKYKQELFFFTYRKVQFVGDDDVELTGLDRYAGEN